MAVYAFFDDGCVKGNGDAKDCTLADPESLEAKIPPASCTLWVLDANAGCTAWVEGCTPGLRELDIVGGTIGSEQITDGSVGTADIAESFSKAGTEVEKREVRMPTGPIRILGDHPVELHLHADVNVAVTVRVVAESEVKA